MAMTEKIVVLFANPYRMEKTKEEGGGFAEGVSIAYLYGDSLDPVRNTNQSLGQRPAKGSLAPHKWEKLVSAPGLYEGTFEMAIGGDGKPTLKLVDVEFLSLVSLTPAKVENKQPKADNKAPY